MASGRHTFSFEGGERLTTIGATFFVSYLYHRHVDSTHRNWDSIKNQKSRINTINRSKSYHRVWLSHIGSMSDANLNNNTLSLDGVTVKKMALAIQKVLMSPVGFNAPNKANHNRASKLSLNSQQVAHLCWRRYAT